MRQAVIVVSATELEHNKRRTDSGPLSVGNDIVVVVVTGSATRARSAMDPGPVHALTSYSSLSRRIRGETKTLQSHSQVRIAR